MTTRRWWSAALANPVPRRRLLSLAAGGSMLGVATALGVSRGLPRVLRPSIVDADGTWIARWRLEDDRFGDGRLSGLSVAHDGVLRLSPGRASGTCVSRTVAAGHRFTLLGISYRAADPHGLGVTFDARTSRDAARWSPWHRLPFEHGFAKGRDETGDTPSTEPLLTDALYFQLRITLRRSGTRATGLHHAEVTVIDVPDRPTLAEALASARRRLGLSRTDPVPVISRADWGANEHWRFAGSGAEIWPPSYVPVSKFVVHHTVTSNTQPGLTQLRAVYAYHALSRGWGDIGYNYLVDVQGNVYEGRTGGGNVVGGHALLFNWGSIGIGNLGTFSEASEGAAGMPPTQAQLRALQSFIGRRANNREIDPRGHGLFWGWDVPNVMGHRDANNKCEGCSTSCPGNYLYRELDTIRKGAARQPTPGDAVIWLSHTVQADYYTKEKQTEVTIVARNTGTDTWRPGGTAPVRLIGRWYSLDLQEYRSEGDLTSAAPVPHDVERGGGAYFKVPLKLPTRAGRYHLSWTLQHQGRPSFAATGSATYDMRVTIRSQKPLRVPSSVKLMVAAGQVVEMALRIDGDGQAWTAATTHPAVRVVPAQGAAPRLVAVRADASGLEPGRHLVTLTFDYLDAVGGSGSVSTVVDLRVRPEAHRSFFPATRS